MGPLAHTNTSTGPLAHANTQINPTNVQTPVKLGGLPQGGKDSHKVASKNTKPNTSQQNITNEITIMYTNPDQMRNKIDEIEDKIDENDPHIIAINEVKPKANGEYSLSDFNCDKHGKYKIFPNNIENDVGRGQLLLVKKSLNHKEVFMNTEFSEAIFMEIKLQKKKDKLIIALVYRSESEGEEMSDKLVKLVNEVCNKGYSHILILGDFNYRTIDWENMSSSSNIEKRFIKCISDNYLHQHVDEPTRWRGTDKPSLLDLILTNEENMVTDIEYQAPVGNSDHAVIVFKFNCYAEENVDIFIKKKYHQANYRKMKQHMQSINWEDICGEKDVGDMCMEILKVYDDLEEKYVPIVKKKSTYKDQMPLDKATRELVNIKTQKSRKVMKLKKKNNNEEELAAAKVEYNRARNKVRKMTRHKRQEYEKKIASGVKTNTKAVFAYMKRRSKTNSGIGHINVNPWNVKSRLTNCNQKKADIFSEYFASVWTDEPPGPIPTLRKRHVRFPMKEIVVTEEAVYTKLKELKTDKAPFPEGVHPLMLKNLAEELAKPITMLYRKSLENKRLPVSWKCSSISVIFKKGIKTLAENYRPISLTCILCKILESIIREHLVDHMLKNALFTDKQYGFIGGRSTALQLLRVLDEWSEAIDEGKDVDVVYMDYRKAFDTVPHKRLIEKVKAYGFAETIVGWLEDFVTGRKQRVQIKGSSSEDKDVKSGIPQGSVLGPFLFLLYVNDLPEQVTSFVYLFADDNKVWKDIANNMDKQTLQHDLDEIHKWSKIWLLQIHPDKLAHVHIGNEMETPQYEYMVGDMIVKYSDMEKDLGVHIDNKLAFDRHITEKIKSANKMAGWIRRSFDYLDKDIFKLLYTSLVRFHLEYCAVVWNPHLWKHIDMIEAVQIRATKMVPGLRSMTYTERLKTLKLPTMTYRRLRGDMITVYKIMKGLYHKECCPKLPTLMEKTGREGRQPLQLYQERSNRDLRKHSFTQRVVSVWNTLPSYVVKAESINDFKSKLDENWRYESVKYDYREPLSCVRVTRKN